VTRESIVAEALSWNGTPYHHAARVKGHGVDCAQFLIAVVEAVTGRKIPVESYPPDWCLHRNDETFLEVLEQHAHRIEGPPLPGDVAMFRWGRTVSHGAVVLDWPKVIHANVPERCVSIDDAVANQSLASRFVGAWSLIPAAA